MKKESSRSKAIGSHSYKQEKVQWAMENYTKSYTIT